MNKEKIKEILTVICVSYTIISIGIALFEAILYQEDRNLSIRLMILLWTSIAIFILYTHPLFEKLSTLMMILLQYIAAQGLVFMTVWISGFFGPLHKQAYFHAFRSFTAIYIIGAAFYYTELLLSIRKQNRLLQDIKITSKKET